MSSAAKNGRNGWAASIWLVIHRGWGRVGSDKFFKGRMHLTSSVHQAFSCSNCEDNLNAKMLATGWEFINGEGTQRSLLPTCPRCFTCFLGAWALVPTCSSHTNAEVKLFGS